MLDQEIIEIAKNIYDTEIKSLEKRMNKLSENFVKVVRKIFDCKGKVVVTGIGKTGIIGKKISATFASTGTTSIFMNSTEGLHGDLGIINPEDIVLAISNSGESDEIIAIMPALAGLLNVQQAFSQFFGGTSLLILVGVVIDTLQQIESHLLMRHYDGLLNSGHTRGGAVSAY